MTLGLEPHPGPVLHVLSGILLVALGAFVGTRRPRRSANVTFGAFAAAWGLATVADWSVDAGPGLFVVDPASPLLPAAQLASAAMLVVASGCLVFVALAFPRPLEPAERRAAALAAAVAAAYAVVATAIWVPAWGELGAAVSPAGLPRAVVGAWDADEYAVVVLHTAASLFALLLLAQRARSADAQARDAERQLHVLLSAAILLHPAGQVGIATQLWQAPSFGPGLVAVAGYAALCVLALLWLRNTLSSDAAAARTARTLALLALALPLAGWMLHASYTRWIGSTPPGILGVARTTTVLILAYAILRHQLLGIDVKLRWTISKGTVAAVFVAVLFVASEAAQLLFGAGNEWLGLAAASALVFALAPLQRAADRLAERAVPVATPAGPSASPTRQVDGGIERREGAYRKAARWAMRDGRIVRDEEIHLHELALQLGIDGRRAHEIIVEVERDAGVPR